jgi:hypothetical protein
MGSTYELRTVPRENTSRHGTELGVVQLACRSNKRRTLKTGHDFLRKIRSSESEVCQPVRFQHQDEG